MGSPACRPALVAYGPGPAVAVAVFPPVAPDPAAHGLGLVGALLGPVHGLREPRGHPFRVWHRVHPPRLGSALGAGGFPGLLEGASLLKGSAVLAQELVSRHPPALPRLGLPGVRDLIILSMPFASPPCTNPLRL